jgi:hypothetical protein
MKYMVAELMFKAEKAWYEGGFICVQLTDKRQIKFPVELNKNLREAPVEKVKNIELICNGTGLHWPDLNEDLTVTGIMEGRFGQSA